ncbi:MAG: AAA family ATPase, partial [Patescibacteria group bacterium]
MPEGIHTKLMETLRVSGLPLNLHEGSILNFGRINYLFGSNGSGKSLTLKNIIQQSKNKLNSSPDLLGKGFFIQHIPVPKQDIFQDQYQFIDDPSSRELSGDLDPSVFYQELSDHPEILIRIRDSLQRYLGRHPNLIKRGINNVMNFLREDDKDVSPYSPNQESDGLRRLSLLLAYIYHPKCLILGIDEPELHLHPDMVSFLLEELNEEIKYGKQFFLATHSPEVIQIGKFDDYAYFYFDLKDKLKGRVALGIVIVM